MQLRLRNVGVVFVGVLAIFLFMGCSKTESKENSKSTSGSASSKYFTQKNSLNPNAPLASYVENPDDWGNGLTAEPIFIYAYYAGCNCPVDYEEIALVTKNSDYASTTDVFERNKILADLKTKADEKIALIKENGGLIKFEYYQKFKGYDFNTKSFHADNFRMNENDDFNSLSFMTRQFKPDEQDYAWRFKFFNELPVPDETSAKQIEAERDRATSHSLTLVFYGQVTKVGTEKYVKQIDAYSVGKKEVARRYIEVTPIKIALKLPKGLTEPITVK